MLLLAVGHETLSATYLDTTNIFDLDSPGFIATIVYSEIFHVLS